jgi:recombination protein RecA
MAKKAEAKPLSENAKTLKTVQLAIRKKFGDGTIISLDGRPDWGNYPHQIPSGSIGLDMALGPMKRLRNGHWQTGYVPGRIVEIFGPEGTGKTTLCLQFIANAQAMGGVCGFLDMEHNLDPLYAMKLGVRMGKDKLTFSQPDTAEQCLDLLELMVSSGCYSVVVVDSVAALVPQDEVEAGMGKAQMGSQGRLMSQAMRKISSRLGRDVSTTVVFTNQIREKVGVMFGNPEITPGGRALKFYASYRLDVRRGKNVTFGTGDDAHVVGHKMRVKVIKNKCAPPFRNTEFSLIYGKGIDAVDELVTACIDTGVLYRSGSFIKYQDRLVSHGFDAAVSSLRGDDEATARQRYFLYDKLLTKNMDNCGYTPDGKPIPGRDPVAATNIVDQFAEFENIEDPFLANEIKEQETAPEDGEEGEETIAAESESSVAEEPVQAE